MTNIVRTKIQFSSKIFAISISILLLVVSSSTNLLLILNSNTAYAKVANDNDDNDIDSLIGTVLNDKINGLGESDIIEGKEGDDILSGGGNNDKISGGTGKDEIYGSSGDDILTGGPGEDVFYCGSGKDTITDFKPADKDRIINPQTCEIVNDGPSPTTTGYLTIKKLINCIDPNNNTISCNNTSLDIDAFNIDVAGSEELPDSYSSSNSSSEKVVAIESSKTYSVQETNSLDPERYTVNTTTSENCEGIIAAGDSKECIIQNDVKEIQQKANLVIKTEMNCTVHAIDGSFIEMPCNNIGVELGNFTIKVIGSNPVPDTIIPTSEYSNVIVDAPGMYTVEETNSLDPKKYDVQVTASKDCTSNSIDTGENKECTLTNNIIRNGP